jgi:hypothetical protein
MEAQTATVPMGRYRTYRAAKRAMDQLQVVGRIPGRRIALRGREMRWREPLNAERALARGAAFGAVLGAVVGIVLWAVSALATDFTWLGALLAGAALGGAAGAIAATTYWRATRDRAGLPETGFVDVGEFVVLVPEDDAPRAREVLAADGAPATPHP